MKAVTSLLVPAISLFILATATPAFLPTSDLATAILTDRNTTTAGTCQEEGDGITRPRHTLEQFYFNVLYGTVITSDMDLFRAAFEKSYSKNLKATANGAVYSYEGFQQFLLMARATNACRRLKNVDFTVVPNDCDGVTGFVGYTAVILAVNDGVPVKITVTSTATVEKDECGAQRIKEETVVAEVQPDVSPRACAGDEGAAPAGCPRCGCDTPPGALQPSPARGPDSPPRE